jgi:hypothetical protein
VVQHNPANERIKRRYVGFLKSAKRQSESTVDGAAEAIYRFEAFSRFRDFKAFHIEQALAFKNHLADDPPRKAAAGRGVFCSHAKSRWGSVTRGEVGLAVVAR